MEQRVVGIGDFDGNGTSDVLWRNASTGHVGWWEVNSGTVTQHSMATSGVDYKVAGIGDFNGDGSSDVFWRNDSGHVGWWEVDNGSPAWHDTGGSQLNYSVNPVSQTGAIGIGVSGSASSLDGSGAVATVGQSDAYIFGGDKLAPDLMVDTDYTALAEFHLKSAAGFPDDALRLHLENVATV